jgi:hypothetical protein
MNIECSFLRVDNYICQFIYLMMNISKLKVYFKKIIQSPHRTFYSEYMKKTNILFLI